MLELVELSGFGDHHPWQLSGGMQQRVVDRTRARVRAGAPADGRAVRRARRDDARAAEPRAALDLAEARVDRRLRHALDLRGGVPLDPGRRDEPARPAAIAGVVDDRPAAPAHRRDARGPALLRARDRRFASCSRERGEHLLPRRATRARRRASSDAASAARSRDRLREWVPAIAVFVLGIASGRARSPPSTSSSSCCRSRPRSPARSGTQRHTLWPAGLVHVQGSARRLRARLGRAASLVATRARPLPARSARH